MTIRPVLFAWDGEVMRPFGSIMARRCDEQFTVGEKYTLVQHEDRSQQSQGHYFASLKDMWSSLPEHLRGEPWSESPESLRKYALIRTGWYNSETFACDSAAEADRWGARLKPLDEYAIIVIKGKNVVRLTAKSQSYSAMPQKGEFYKSKADVLGFVADLLTLPPDAEQRQVMGPRT